MTEIFLPFGSSYKQPNLDDLQIVAYDVDGTLCHGPKKPEGIAESIARIAQIQAAKAIRAVRARVALISDSPIEDLRKKITDDIIRTLNKENPDASEALVVYSSGGTVKFTYKKGNDGQIEEIYDPEYGCDFELPKALIIKSEEELEQILSHPNFWGSTQQEQERIFAKLKQWGQNEGPEGRISEMQERPDLTIQVVETGYVSINPNPGRMRGKIMAIDNLMVLTDARPDEAIYIGDEFQENGNNEGLWATGIGLINVGKTEPNPELGDQIINLAGRDLHGPELALILNNYLIKSLARKI